MKTMGVDLGGSHVMAALVDEDGTITHRAETDIEDLTFGAVVKTIADTIQAALADAGETSAPPVGIGSPGNVDPSTGAINYSPNFGWHDVPLGAELSHHLGARVLVGNDARCATLGEHTFGSGKAAANFVMLTLGTGIGGGIVAGNTLLIGNRAGAGEFGHHQVRATDGFICGCGKTGCFEAQASGTGLLRHAFAVGPSFPKSTLLSGKREKLGSKGIRKAAEAGDPHALSAWRRYVDDLAIGLANVIAFVNPEIIALGGGVSSAGDFMLDAVRPKVEQLTTMVPRGTTKIVTATLGNDAGAIGASVMARRGGLLAQEKHA
jgi:glucokinase